MRSEGVVWEQGSLTRAQRWESLRTHGVTVWLTGLPASGKSTIAKQLEQRLVLDGRHAYRLDGDNLRHGVCGDLGFDPASRDENVRRTGEVAKLFADAGTVAVVCLVSPYAEARRRVRESHERDGLPFVEVWVSTPVEECERRDPKGLYAKARRGELTGMTGVDAPYEAPESPEIEATVADGVDASVERILALLASLPRP